MINFNNVENQKIPEGNVSKITQNGIILWQRLSKINYIKSHGLEHIDLGIVPDADTKVVLDFALDDTAQSGALLGASNTDGTKQYGFIWDGSTQQYVSIYGEQNSNTWKTGNPYSRQVVEIDGSDTTYEGVTKSYEKDDFVVPETLKLFANCKNAPITYEWYRYDPELSDFKRIENENTEDLYFNGRTEEANTYYVTARNMEDSNGEVVFSRQCVVSVEDKSLLSGAKYNHNATENNWYYNYNTTGDPNVFDYNGEFLTDGNIFNDYWQDKYFGVKNFDPVITFDLDEPIVFKEIDIYMHDDSDPDNAKASVYEPSNVTVEFYDPNNKLWYTLFDGSPNDADLILVSEKAIEAKKLRFSFVRNGNFCFIDEIRAFPEHTGLTPDGIMEPKQELNTIEGLYPNSYSKLPKGWAAGCTTDYGVLTDGDIKTDADSYQQNIAFYDDEVSFCYDVNDFVNKILVYSHKNDVSPTQKVAGINTITIKGYVGGEEYIIVTGSADTQNPFEYVIDECPYFDMVKITMTRKKGTSDWNGISLSEIQILRPETPYVFKEVEPIEVNDENVETENSEIEYAIQAPVSTATGLTPRFILNLDKQKTVNVLDKFALTAVAVADNNTIFDNTAIICYGAQVYKKGVLVGYFVPRLNSKGEAGLYNKVTNTFHGNQGEGAFEFE